ncbi:uncharacterized protein LOC121761225 isoform X1 [Salvia splendens]|uniref:uncharacterized protein LOC121761225 isoform X1 n=1 Tax=Salvia splendens TaxID=180675 RepID=UPI001C2720C6|nr:uncharacterized protein LOC121761225 isoform X1 [Salvia splendens]
MVFVSLYWDGKITQLPGLGVAYEPPRANSFIILSENISYYQLVSMICEKIGIDLEAHTIDLTWRHPVVFSGVVNYIATPVNENLLEYMFAENPRQIELFIEYTPVTTALQFEPPINQHDVGTSRRDDYHSFDVGTSRRDDEYHNTEFNTFGREVDEQLDVPNVPCDVYDGADGLDNCDGSDGSDICAGLDGSENCAGIDGSDCDGSDGSSQSDREYSAESCEDSTDDETLQMMGEKCVQPAVRGEQPVPDYVTEGLPFFRSLPCEGSRGYVSEDHGVGEEDMWYWDEDNPRHIDVGTKFDSKLQLKTAVTLWHVGTGRMYEVMDSKSRRWHAVCRDPFGPKRKGEDLGQRYPCNWEVKATFKKRDGSWSINSWVDRHCCMGDHDPSEHVNLTSSMIALCIRSQIENDVEFKPSAVRTYIKDKFHVKISYKKAWYARRKAIELVYGGWEGSFRQLPSYLFELQSQNPGTIVEWLHDPILRIFMPGHLQVLLVLK